MRYWMYRNQANNLGRHRAEMTNVTTQTASRAATWKPPPLSMSPWCSVTHFPTTLHTFCSHALRFHKSSPHFIPRWLRRHPLQLCYDPALGWVSCQPWLHSVAMNVLLYECLSIMHSGLVALATAESKNQIFSLFCYCWAVLQDYSICWLKCLIFS